MNSQKTEDMTPPRTIVFSLILFLYTFSAAVLLGAAAPLPPVTNSLLPSDAVSLLSFKANADLANRLHFSLNERFDYCEWVGVKCVQGRVVRLVLRGFGLVGGIAPNTLTRLDQLRVLNLESNSLSGPIPDLSPLKNLQAVLMSWNHFSGTFPLSILSLNRLTVLDLSHNNLTGSIPVAVNNLRRLSLLKLEFNRLTGVIPPLNQSTLSIFNVSANKLSGMVPVTPTLSRLAMTSFSLNPNLCGELVNRACVSGSPFFEPQNATSSQPVQETDPDSGGGGGVMIKPTPPSKNRRRYCSVLGIGIGVGVLIACGVCASAFLFAIRKPSEYGDVDERESKHEETTVVRAPKPVLSKSGSENTLNSEMKTPEKKSSKIRVELLQPQATKNSSHLVFCSREPETFTMDQLMRSSAELLGRGSIGTTYKAVLDNQLIVTVKRLDALKTAVTGAEAFEQLVEAIGKIRHQNVVPVRAYFQAQGERLIVYDYHHNGSLYNLISGSSRSSRTKPLHWTSCLKISEDIARGLTYLHQKTRLVHGNLKSSNILLGADFEACITDYCLSALTDTSFSLEDPSSTSTPYKSPELRKSNHRPNPKSDVYAFGVLLIELLTGKHPSRHPFLAPQEMIEWVRTVRENDDGSDDCRLGMLTEIATVCSVTSPEQRPAIWQVLKMIQEIKENPMVGVT